MPIDATYCSEEIYLRSALQNDSQSLWEWRNDPQTCAMSQNSAPVSWEDHSRGFEASLKNPQRLILIGCSIINGKIGMCRFDSVIQSAEVSINMNPVHRGKGLSKPLLSGCIQFFLKQTPLSLRATIHKNNAPSQRLFTQCAFIKKSEQDSFYFYERNAIGLDSLP
jgi:UDP-2,4-diacetamido-2,4,6-trideoxy-beta-L-altropyranose hydrolase